MASHSGLGTGHDWRPALTQALRGREPGPCDLAIVFASHEYRDDYRAILEAVREELQPSVIAGCSGQGIIGRRAEVEREPAISVLALDLPGAQLQAARLTPDDALTMTAAGWQERSGVRRAEVNAWLLFADPFTMDCERLIESLGEAYPGVPIVGGMASGHPASRNTDLFLDGQLIEDGAVAVAVGGDWTVSPIVSQGAAPIGEAWTITLAEANFIQEIAGRPAVEVLIDTVRGLDPELQRRVTQNLLVGLAMDEYRDEFGRGDFLIRNLLGVDQRTGAIAIGALPRSGQTVQFQVRDAEAAHDELEAMLASNGAATTGADPAGAVIFSCNGRGSGLFGPVDHDPTAVARRFGELPVAGFFCNGEIGPVGGRNYLHGFTASIALFRRNDAASD